MEKYTQTELLELSVKEIDHTLNMHLQCLLDEYLRGASIEIINYSEKHVMAFTLVRTILKTYKKELDAQEK